MVDDALAIGKGDDVDRRPRRDRYKRFANLGAWGLLGGASFCFVVAEACLAESEFYLLGKSDPRWWLVVSALAAAVAMAGVFGSLAVKAVRAAQLVPVSASFHTRALACLLVSVSELILALCICVLVLTVLA